MYYGGLTWAPDQYSEAKIVTASGNGYEGPAVRMSSNDTHYACIVFNTGTGNAAVEIILDNATAISVLAGSTTATVRPGDVVRCTISGTALSMTNQTTQTTLVTATDNTISERVSRTGGCGGHLQCHKLHHGKLGCRRFHSTHGGCADR